MSFEDAFGTVTREVLLPLMIFALYVYYVCLGYLDIRSGVSSEGDSLLALSGPPALSLMGLDMPRGGFTSRDGLYIRLSMLNQPGGLLAFTFGIFHAQEDLLNTGGISILVTQLPLLNSNKYVYKHCRYISLD